MLSRLRRAYDALTGPVADPAPADTRWRGWNAQLTQIRAAYEAALPREDLWTLADFRDADATLQAHIRQRIRSRTRYEFGNNPLVTRIVRVWANDVVAASGPWLKVKTGEKRVDQFIETAWLRWWEKSGQAATLRTAVKSEATDGEGLGLLIDNPAILEDQHPDSAVSLDVLGLETDRLADPSFSGSHLEHYIDGVHLDPRTRQPVAYDILKAHPGTDALDALTKIYEHETFGRREVLHAYKQDRAEQHRGVSRYVSVAGIGGYHRKYLEADLNRQQLRAAFFAMFKSMAPPEEEGGGEAGGDSRWWQSVNLPGRSGVGCILPDGYEPVQFSSSGESAELDQFHRIVAGLVAGCFCMPLGRALGVYGSAGYAPIRGEMGPYHHEIQSDREQIWNPRYLQPTYRAFLRYLRHTRGWEELMEQLQSENENFDEARLDLTNTTWCWPDKELVVDPSREEEAKRKKMARGAIAREDEIDSADLDEHDRRCARGLGFGDDEEGVRQFRQFCAASIHGRGGKESGAGEQAPGRQRREPDDEPDDDEPADD